MTKSTFDVAVVGCGRISKNHFRAIAKLDGMQLSAVCDIDAERAKTAGAQEGVPSFTSLERMLADALCDIVAICTPSGLHPVQGIAVAKAGKHVLTEKPMAAP